MLFKWFQIFQRAMIIHLKFAFLLMVVLQKSHTRSLPLTRIRWSSVMHRQPLTSSFWAKPAIEGEAIIWSSTPIFSLIMTWRTQMNIQSSCYSWFFLLDIVDQMCLHLRMAQFDQILNPCMAKRYTHGQSYYGKKEIHGKVKHFVRFLYGAAAFSGR